MKIIKASAGSGKTYRLSQTYRKYLFESSDPKAYRHILAVTFTNKATAEMKARILKDLKEESATNPKARDYLVGILHDYSAFSVSTIDRFFQQTLRAFARELGQFSSYQVELNKSDLVEEAMDRVLDGVGPDKPELVAWLKTNAFESLRQSGSFQLDEGLKEMGLRLKSEEYRKLRQECRIDEPLSYSRERLNGIRKLCRKIRRDFETKAAELGIMPDKAGSAVSYPKNKLKDPDLIALFGRPFVVYATAILVERQLYSLGVARDFYAEYDALLKERNVLPLDDSGLLLRQIIDGSDAPFVYEKTGSRYFHFLLDEFQDTSYLQWDNFLPLLQNADAGGENLIVGDVKQSIYRWRDSDWRLLDHEVQAAFPSADVENMEFNWRSARKIVEFNSDFFEYAAAKVGFSGMYSNVKQKPRNKEPQEGFVRVSFTNEQVDAVLSSIREVREAGGRFSDIAILVRNHVTGSLVADALIEERIPVISDDSLNLKSSVTVRRLVSLLTFYDDPSNTVGSYFAKSMGVQFPDSFHSLIDFSEHLLRELRKYDANTFDAETLYVGAFMDMLQDWVSVYGNNIKEFLAGWAEKKDVFIGSPETSDAVRILTVHKAKGLEFPHVIFPYADGVELFRSGTRWCKLDGGGTALGHEADGIYPVSLSSTSLRTLFASAYEDEYKLQVVDGLNLFYVAFTRAQKSMHIIAKPVAKGKKEQLEKGKDIKFSYFSEILYAWCGCCEMKEFGTPYDFKEMERDEPSNGIPLPAHWNSVPLGGRLGASQDASDYFGDDGAVGPAASGRLRGIELHRILSGVDSAEDLPAGMVEEDRALLSVRIGAHPEWFGSRNARNELTVFAADGSRYRPDRVVLHPDGSVSVIDYKFGTRRDSYLWQVRRYVKLYNDMGYTGVRGYVWYVPSDTVETV